MLGDSQYCTETAIQVHEQRFNLRQHVLLPRLLVAGNAPQRLRGNSGSNTDGDDRLRRLSAGFGSRIEVKSRLLFLQDFP